MRTHKAVSLTSREIDHQRCEASQFKHEAYRIVLYTTSDTHIPFQLEIYKGGKLDVQVRYISYQTDLPFDASLFEPPSGITIIEEPPK
jgi:outer membrane lipoprotein-sorting protein